MRQKVTVLRVEGGTAQVLHHRPTACAGDCGHCGGCSATAVAETMVVEAENPIGARPGDTVFIETDTKTVFSAVFLAYLLPLVLFFVGYAAASATAYPAACGVLGFVLGVLIAVLVGRSYGRRQKRQATFRITAFAGETSCGTGTPL